MYSARLPALIENADNNKYYFDYSNSAIICKEIDHYGSMKETMLVNQVSEPFLVALGRDNTIYLACHSKNRGIILFTYADNSWLMNEILYINPSISVCLLEMYIIGSSVHILYATGLPLVNYYNVYHLHDMSGSFKKSSISEIYSEDLERSFCAALAKDSILSFIAIWNDGKYNILNHYYYDIEEDMWTASKVAALSNSNIRVDLLAHGTRLHLLCHTFEDNLAILFYFTKKAVDRDGFEFISMSKFELDEYNKKPLFYFLEDQLYVEWLFEKALYRMQFIPEMRAWSDQSVIPFDDRPAVIKHLKAASGGAGILRHAYIDDHMNLKTVESKAEPAEEDREAEASSEPLKIQSMDELIPYLVKQISTLTEDIKTIQTKLNQNSEKTEGGQRAQTSQGTAQENAETKDGYHENSRFKENFMNNKPSSGSANKKSNAGTNQKKQAPPKKNTSFKDKFISGEITYGGPISTSSYQGMPKNSRQAVAISHPQSTKKAFDKKSNGVKMTEEKENSNMFVAKDNGVRMDGPSQPIIPHAGNSVITSGNAPEILEKILSEEMPASVEKQPQPPAPDADIADQKKASPGLLKKLGDFFKQM